MIKSSPGIRKTTKLSRKKLEPHKNTITRWSWNWKKQKAHKKNYKFKPGNLIANWPISSHKSFRKKNCFQRSDKNKLIHNNQPKHCSKNYLL